jgi:peptidoglycan-associated lipoprotein
MLHKNKILAGVAAAAFALVLAGCSSGGETKADATGHPDPIGGGPTTDSYNGGGTGGHTSGPDLTSHSVYFDFDKSDIKGDSLSVVTNWAAFLSKNPTSRVRLEGNTDERGTREYNIGLGERRANAVAQALEAKGVSASQLTTISYGKERPVALGHDEDSWSKNRRVDLVQQ